MSLQPSSSPAATGGIKVHQVLQFPGRAAWGEPYPIQSRSPTLSSGSKNAHLTGLLETKGMVPCVTPSPGHITAAQGKPSSRASTLERNETELRERRLHGHVLLPAAVQ